MSDNMKVWDKLKRPPTTALKTIRAGRLKGMSDINPQWRYEIMTDTFGMCGIGWKYEIVRTWVEHGSDGQISQFAEVMLYVKSEDKWSDGIPAVGGSTYVNKESKGLYTNDECCKMAVTDALGTAMKMLGVAADIYKGLWDGSKYADDKDRPLLGFEEILEKLNSTKNVRELDVRKDKYMEDMMACSKKEFEDLKSAYTHNKNIMESEGAQNEN